MTYWKMWKEPNAEWVEITREQALDTLLTSYKDNQLTRDFLDMVGEYPCMFSYIKVTE